MAMSAWKELQRAATAPGMQCLAGRSKLDVPGRHYATEDVGSFMAHGAWKALRSVATVTGDEVLG